MRIFILCSFFILTVAAFFTLPVMAQNDQAVVQALDDWEQAIARHKEIGGRVEIVKLVKPAATRPWQAVESSHQTLEEDLDTNHKFEFKERFTREKSVEKFPTHEFEVGYESYYYEYKEDDLIEISGAMNGLSGSYTYRPQKNDPLHFSSINLYRFEAQYAAADLDYTSPTQNLSVDDRPNNTYDTRLLFGKEYVYRSAPIMLYGGVGYRFLRDESKGRVTVVNNQGFVGYDRESNYYYVPMGADATFTHKDWKMTLNVEYAHLIRGRQFSSETGFNLHSSDQDIEYTQNNGYGFRASLNVAKKLTRMDMFVEPFFRYWDIEQSNAKEDLFNGSFGGVVEPANHTSEIGFKLGAHF